MLKFLTKKIIIYAVVAIVIVAGAYMIFGGENGKQVIVVEKGDVIEQVSATGKVEPNREVELGFDRSGKIGAVYSEVGDLVSAGNVIASLEAFDLRADVSKALALLEEEKIKLRELRSTTPKSFSDANKNLESAIRDGFVAADNSVRNRVDQFFKNIPDNPQFEVKFENGNFVHYFAVPSNTVLNLNRQRSEVEIILNNWKTKINDLDPKRNFSDATGLISDLNKVAIFLGDVAQAVNTFTPAKFEYETTVTTYKSTVSSARTEVSKAITDLVAAKEKFNSAPVVSEGGDFETILGQEAKVAQAEAALGSLRASLAKTSMVAPFSGVITKQDAKVGGTVSAGASLVSLASQNQMYIEANISEINIGKVLVGNRVNVNFDAFPSEVFSGKVTFIEPGDLILEGVVNYKIRVELDNFDDKIKKGLTANLDIETSRKNDVLSVPLYALTKEGDLYYANKVVGNNIERVPVQIGLVGYDGRVEILEGLSSGDTLQF